MLFYLLSILFIIAILLQTQETFINTSEINYQTKNIVDIPQKEQKYLDFLDFVRNKTSPSCSIREVIPDKQVLQNAFSNIYGNEEKNKFHKDNCVNISTDICETTSPFMLIYQRSFPPPWLLNTYKNINYQKETNLKCYKNIYDCCKTS